MAPLFDHRPARCGASNTPTQRWAAHEHPGRDRAAMRSGASVNDGEGVHELPRFGTGRCRQPSRGAARDWECRRRRVARRGSAWVADRRPAPGPLRAKRAHPSVGVYGRGARAASRRLPGRTNGAPRRDGCQARTRNEESGAEEIALPCAIVGDRRAKARSVEPRVLASSIEPEAATCEREALFDQRRERAVAAHP